MHENLATILQNPVGLGILDDSRQNLLNICVDPHAHNAIIGLLDGITDVATNPDVSQTIGNMFFWTRKVIKGREFQKAWLQAMVGVNRLFNHEKAAKRAVRALLDGSEKLLKCDQFDDKFEKVVEKLAQIISLKNNVDNSYI